MLTRLRVRNFKRFEQLDVELGANVVFIGPNNSGKTSALQALALWQLGLQGWLGKRGDGPVPEQRPGVAMNRKDLFSVPVPDAALLWRGLRYSQSRKANGRTKTEPLHIEIVVDGVDGITPWSCGIELDYANEESIRARPIADADTGVRVGVPDAALAQRIELLPPMAGLVAQEPRIDIGAIAVRIGEGRTSEVLRNLCYLVQQRSEDAWGRVCDRITRLFHAQLLPPRYLAVRGEITMSYRDVEGVELDISSAGRGMQQVLLLLTYLETNPGCVLLLDEPDAHLETLRQRQIYHELTQAARSLRSQIVAASHSEVWMNEAADRDLVVAFVGTPHRIDDRAKAQVAKALKSIGFDQYYEAERRGWVLYLEGSTDLAILRAFAKVLGHRAEAALDSPFVHYVGNVASKAREHFYGLRQAKADLVGIAVFDADHTPQAGELREVAWVRREIENYLCQPDTLRAFAMQRAEAVTAGPLFETSQRESARDAMERAIRRRVPPAALDNPHDRFWHSMKATDDFLDLVFQDFYRDLELPDLMRKADYHELAPFVARAAIDADVLVKLDAIAAAADEAASRSA